MIWKSSFLGCHSVSIVYLDKREAPLGNTIKAEPKPAREGFWVSSFPEFKTVTIAPWGVATCVFIASQPRADVHRLIIWVHLHGHGHFWGVWTPRNPGGAHVTDSALPQDLLETRQKMDFSLKLKTRTLGQSQFFTQDIYWVPAPCWVWVMYWVVIEMFQSLLLSNKTPQCFMVKNNHFVLFMDSGVWDLNTTGWLVSAGSFLITVSISVLVICLFIFSISSWFSLGRFYISKNLSISSRLSILLEYSCL